jgi:hypothetical protein
MDTLSDIQDTSYDLPLSEADQAALRPALLRDLGAMPFTPGAPISRSLWVTFIGEWGAWTHAVLPGVTGDQRGRCAHLSPGAPGGSLPGDRTLDVPRGGTGRNTGGDGALGPAVQAARANGWL